MTLKDKATIQRAIGMIEGIAASEEEAKKCVLYDAIVLIESVLNKKEKINNPKK